MHCEKAHRTAFHFMESDGTKCEFQGACQVFFSAVAMALAWSISTLLCYSVVSILVWLSGPGIHMSVCMCVCVCV